MMQPLPVYCAVVGSPAVVPAAAALLVRGLLLMVLMSCLGVPADVLAVAVPHPNRESGMDRVLLLVGVLADVIAATLLSPSRGLGMGRELQPVVVGTGATEVRSLKTHRL